MAGPTASIIVPDSMNDELRADIRADVKRMSTKVDADDFWIQGRPFILTLGPEYEGELEEYVTDGVPQVIGWTPRDTIGLAAMCNERQDHLILGHLCLHFVRKTNGLVDFGGALTPPIRCEVQRLFDEHYSGAGTSWADWEPHFRTMIQDLPGHVYAVPYTTADRHAWVSHLCDADFLEAWLQHPDFHMVK